MIHTPRRYLLYSHDTYGLGHIRRTTAIASGIVETDPTATVLIVTGSPVGDAFALPDRVDLVRLPTATKAADGGYRARRLDVGLEQLVAVRGSIIAATAAAFCPDVVLVDHAPTGMANELLPLLRNLAELPIHRRPRLAIGLRDIIDDAATTERAWQRTGVWEWIDLYDDVLVFGDARIVTTADELDLDRRLGAAVHHVGIVAPRPDVIRHATERSEPTQSRPFVLVSAGGGGDGQQLLRSFLDAADDGALRDADLDALVITGPLMSEQRRAEIHERSTRHGNVRVVDFTNNMLELLATATATISMAGYNTVAEQLAVGVPSLLVPRTHPRQEQALRARRIAPYAAVEHCPSESLTPARIADFLDRSASDGHEAGARRRETQLDLGGIAATAQLLATPFERTATIYPTPRAANAIRAAARWPHPTTETLSA